jgi:hypothetical protein
MKFLVLPLVVIMVELARITHLLLVDVVIKFVDLPLVMVLVTHLF